MCIRDRPAKPSYKYQDVFPTKHVFHFANAIREKLGTESIDVLQFHAWDDSWAEEAEFRETVEKLKSDGLIRSFGLSLNRWEPANGIKAIRTGLVDAVQVIYNIFDQSPEDELFPVCDEFNVGVIARVPLDEGSLGGNLTFDTKFPEGDWRGGYFGPENLKNTVERVEELKKIIPSGICLLYTSELAREVVIDVLFGRDRNAVALRRNEVCELQRLEDAGIHGRGESLQQLGCDDIPLFVNRDLHDHAAFHAFGEFACHNRRVRSADPESRTHFRPSEIEMCIRDSAKWPPAE